MIHVRKQYHRWSFRLSVLGKYVDAGESYEDEMSAGVAADLAKHYFESQYRLVLAPSLDGEMFSCLAYSRRSVDLSSSYSVEKALAPGVKTFIGEFKSELEAHRDAQPALSISSKFRNSGMIDDPRIREWVEKCEAAALEARAFSTINSEYLFRLLESLPDRLTDVIKPLRLALKMHSSLTNPRLASRATKLKDLILHLESDVAYVADLTVALRAEQAEVEREVADLEANRPGLT